MTEPCLVMQTLNGPRGMPAERSGSRTSRSVSRERDLSRHHFTPTQDPVVHLNRYQRAFAEKADQSPHQPVQLARVMFDFHALSVREISVQKNDTVIVRKQIDANWFEIEDPASGLRGIVPRNYLDADQDGAAVAKFDFDAKTPLELPFRKGDRLKLIRKVDDNWYEGTHQQRNQIGIFPCSYVDTIKQPISKTHFHPDVPNHSNLSFPSPLSFNPHTHSSAAQQQCIPQILVPDAVERASGVRNMATQVHAALLLHTPCRRSSSAQ